MKPKEASTIASRQSGIWVLLAWALLSVVCFQTLRMLRIGAYREELTLSASTAFVALAFWGGGISHAFGRLMTAGLIACWFGDMLGPGNFVLGACCFLVAHLCFIPALLLLRPSLRNVAWAAAATSLAGILSVSTFLPHAPEAERVLLIGYTTVISVMLCLALSVFRTHRVVTAAALLFYVSDLFVARWKYFGDDWNGLVCYPLYYLSCILFAYSVFLHSKARATAG